MHFHFCLFNHRESFDTLTDMRVWFSAGLRALGHTVTESLDQLDTSAFNVLFERFPSGTGAELKRMGIRYGIVATEIPEGDTFNGRTDGTWKDRWIGFVEAAEGASFIWSMLGRQCRATRHTLRLPSSSWDTSTSSSIARHRSRATNSASSDRRAPIASGS
jgi:hypothetical protein